MRSGTVGIVAMLALALLGAPLAAAAQPPGKIPRIGLLLPATPPVTAPLRRTQVVVLPGWGLDLRAFRWAFAPQEESMQ
jgi:hypothetical protein